jgi:hypothetical protein
MHGSSLLGGERANPLAGGKTQRVLMVHSGYDGCDGIGMSMMGLVLLAWLCGVADGAVAADPAPPAPSADQAALREFGSAALPPIDTGILIYNNRYIKPPYIIARHGLDILINDLPVEAGQSWPPFDPLVPTDPGDPPPGTHPWDPEDPSIRSTLNGPWPRKCRYLLSHFPFAEARRTYANLIAACMPGLRVELDPDEKDLITITFADGHTLGLEMGSPPVAVNANREDYLKVTVKTMERFWNSFQAGQLVGLLGSTGQWGIDPKMEKRFFDILLSRSSGPEKIQLLTKEHFFSPTNRQLIDVLEHFDPGGDALYLRFGKVPPSYDGTPAVTGRWMPPDQHAAAAELPPAAETTQRRYAIPIIAGTMLACAGLILIAWRRSKH